MPKSGIAAILLALLLSAGVVSAQDEDVCFAHGGMIDPETGVCSQRGGLTFDLQFPLELLDMPFAAETVEAFLRDLRLTYAGMLVTDAWATTNGYPYTLNASYELYPASERYLSVVYTIAEYTGGAHPNAFFRTFTFDLDAEAELALDDLFTSTDDALAILAPIVQADLAEQMGADAEGAWIDEGANAVPENYQQFALTEEGILFLFPPYQVAPYVAGDFAVTVPYDALADVLAVDVPTV